MKINNILLKWNLYQIVKLDHIKYFIDNIVVWSEFLGFIISC